MPAEQKQVTKVLWVIKTEVRPSDKHRLMRDIIRGMFKSDEDFKAHVTVIFTFSDKAPLEDHDEWLHEFLGGLPIPKSV